MTVKKLVIFNKDKSGSSLFGMEEDGIVLMEEVVVRKCIKCYTSEEAI